MIWKIAFVEPVEKFLDSRSLETQVKVKEVFNLFEEFGLSLGEPYLKKIKGTRGLWEFRVKKTRLLFFIKGKRAIIVHGFVKKTRQTPKRDLKLAERRMRLIKRS